MLTVLDAGGKVIGTIVAGSVQTEDPILLAWFTFGVRVVHGLKNSGDITEVVRLVTPENPAFSLAVCEAAEARGWAIVSRG